MDRNFRTWKMVKVPHSIFFFQPQPSSDDHQSHSIIVVTALFLGGGHLNRAVHDTGFWGDHFDVEPRRSQDDDPRS